jgi:hypothetical protein
MNTSRYRLWELVHVKFIVHSTKFQHRNIQKYLSESPEGKI